MKTEQLEIMQESIIAISDLLAVAASQIEEISKLMSGENEAKASYLTPRIIAQMVANYYCISLKQLIKGGRARHKARKRQLAMVLCREHTNVTYGELAEFFNADHTTIIHAEKMMDDYRQVKEYDHDYLMLTQYLSANLEEE